MRQSQVAAVGGGIPPSRQVKQVVGDTCCATPQTSQNRHDMRWGTLVSTFGWIVKILRGLCVARGKKKDIDILRLFEPTCQRYDRRKLMRIHVSGRLIGQPHSHNHATIPSMPTLRLRRRPKIIRVPASSAAALMACSAAVPDEVVSTAAPVPAEVASAAPSSASCPQGQPESRCSVSKRKHVVMEASQKESQPRSTTTEYTRHKRTTLEAKIARPATLIRRGDVKHKYAASLKEHFFRADWKRCRNEDNRETKCKCHRSVDGAFLSAIEEYVDSTWKELSSAEKLAVAKAQSPAESCGIRGKFYMPFENGSQFHPVCANTFCRLLGCPANQFPQIKRALTDRDWLAHRS